MNINTYLNEKHQELNELINAELNVKIHPDSLRVKIKKVPNWRMPGHDSIHILKNQFHPYSLAIEMNKCFEETDIPEWMAKGKTTLIQKDPQKETVQTIMDL